MCYVFHIEAISIMSTSNIFRTRDEGKHKLGFILGHIEMGRAFLSLLWVRTSCDKTINAMQKEAASRAYSAVEQWW